MPRGSCKKCDTSYENKGLLITGYCKSCAAQEIRSHEGLHEVLAVREREIETLHEQLKAKVRWSDYFAWEREMHKKDEEIAELHETTDLVPPGVLNNKVSTKPEEWPPALRVQEMPKGVT